MGNRVLLMLLAWVLLPIYAQEPVEVQRTDNKVIIEGKVYYVHVVKPGQTLYSIARAYNVSEEELTIENPGITPDLRIGQVLKIPAMPASEEQVDTRDTGEEWNTHRIRRGETVYSIAKQHNTTVEELLQVNPGVDIDDLQIGQEIRIPQPRKKKNEQTFNEEGFLYHSVKRGETLYSIARYYGVNVEEIQEVNKQLRWGGPRAGQTLRIPKPETTTDDMFVRDTIPPDTLEPVRVDTMGREPYTYDELRGRFRFRDETYRIAYLVPFDYEEHEPLDSLLRDVESPVRRERIREDYAMRVRQPESVEFLEFMEGSLLAIDSMRRSGLKLEVSFFDTRRSMHHMRQILGKPEMLDMDLIIGPFYSFNLELAEVFAREHRIPLVTPFHNSLDLVKDNPYLFQANPSYQAEYNNNARYIARQYDSNLVLVHQGDSAILPRINDYKEALYNELKSYSALENVQFKEVVLDDGNPEALMHALRDDMKNLVILPATDEAFASQVASNLYFQRDNYDIMLFGSPYWAGFKNIEIEYHHGLRVTMSHNQWYDFSDPALLDFLNKYRQHYFREPESVTRKGCRFAMIGYDVSIFFLSAMKEYGEGFILHMDEYRQKQTLCNYRFRRVTPYGGYENKALEFYQFTPDFEIVRVDIPREPGLHYYLRPADDLFPGFVMPRHRKDSIRLDNF